MQKRHPLAYINQVFKGRALSLSTYKKEMLAILLAVKKWYQYLLGRRFTIRTDQRSLKFLLDQRFREKSQQPWLIKLVGFDYIVEYKKGTNNKVADAISRRDEEVRGLGRQCKVTSVVEPEWLDQVRTMVNQSPDFQELHAKVDKGSLSPSQYQKVNGVWCYKERVRLEPTTELHHTIFLDHHASLGGGHSGFHRTLWRIKQSFWWQGMKNFVREAIRECEVCQRNKGENVASPGLLSPLPLPNKVWEDVSMDFVDGLPPSQGKTIIMVVVDRLSKFAHFVALHHPYTTPKVAQIFLEEIVSLYSYPKTIVSNHDTIFLSAFCIKLFKLQGTQLHHSSAYHPQSDGQTERINQSLECYLRCFCNLKPSEWKKWFPWAIFWHNTTWNSSTGFTPY